jgi:hypothetical protein
MVGAGMDGKLARSAKDVKEDNPLAADVTTIFPKN